MHWTRLWLLVGCLALWSGGTALPGHAATLAAPSAERSAHDLAPGCAGVAAFDDDSANRTDDVGARLRLQADAHLAPHWAQRSIAPRQCFSCPAALAAARRATAPPLAGTVELLI